MTMKTKIIIAPILSSLIAIVIFTVLHSFSLSEQMRVSYLNDGWNIYHNSVLQDTDNLTEFKSWKTVKPGDEVILERVMDDSYNTIFPALIFKTEFAAMEVYLDDELIRSWCMNKYENTDFIFNRHHFISFARSFHGETLSIHLYPTANGIEDYCNDIVFGDYSSVETYVINAYVYPIIVGMFLIVFGASLLFISIIFYSFMPQIKVQIYSSLLCLLTGVWLHSFYDVHFIFMNDMHTTIIGFSMLHIMVPIAYLIIGEIRKYLNKKAFNIIAYTSMALCILLMLLHFLHIFSFIQTLPVFMVMGLVLLVIVFYEFIMDTRKHELEKGSRIILLSLFVPALWLIVCGIISIFNHGNFEGSHTPIYYIIVTSTMIYAMFIMIYYLTYVTESYALQREYESLEHLAYADGLTDLPNRSLYEKDLIALDKEKNVDYCIISLDLNGLKDINDTMGHSYGDSLIKDFSSTLKRCFAENSTCYRIGGDEFTVIMRKGTPEEIESLLNKLSGSLQAMNIISPKYTRSVAYGYAFKHECGTNNSRMVYLLADKRMYAMKRAQHEKMNLLPRV